MNRVRNISLDLGLMQVDTLILGRLLNIGINVLMECVYLMDFLITYVGYLILVIGLTVFPYAVYAMRAMRG